MPDSRDLTPEQLTHRHQGVHRAC